MSELLESKYNKIQWILCMDSGKKWPIVWITVCTHWWETVWLEVVEYLLHKFGIKKKLLMGKMYCILTNIEAYKKNIQLKNQWDDEYVIKSRYLEENMNRCCSLEDMQNPITYERKRVCEIEPILKTLDYHIDIHSTMSPTWSMCIYTKKSKKHVGDVFDTDEVYIWLPEIVIGKPLIDITERNWWIGVVIETGNQTNTEWYRVWIHNVMKLLWKLNMIKVEERKKERMIKKKPNIVYKVVWSILIKSKYFSPAKKFKHLDMVHKWVSIAYEENETLSAKQDAYIIMPSEAHIGEEYCFLATRV